MSLSPFDYVKAITETKKDLSIGNAEFKSQYVPYIVNKSLSYHNDTLFFANEMNRYFSLDKDMQFSFYLHGIRKKSRYSKWVKADEPQEDLEAISKYYSFSVDKAKSVYDLLTKEQIDEIKSHYFAGGK